MTDRFILWGSWMPTTDRELEWVYVDGCEFTQLCSHCLLKHTLIHTLIHTLTHARAHSHTHTLSTFHLSEWRSNCRLSRKWLLFNSAADLNPPTPPFFICLKTTPKDFPLYKIPRSSAPAPDWLTADILLDVVKAPKGDNPHPERESSYSSYLRSWLTFFSVRLINFHDMSSIKSVNITHTDTHSQQCVRIKGEEELKVFIRWVKYLRPLKSSRFSALSESQLIWVRLYCE